MHRISEIVESLNGVTSFSKDDYAIFPEKGHEPYPISRENFHTFEKKQSDRRMVFVDGGNAEILAAPNFSVHFVRVFCSVWKGNKRQALKKQEFYSVTAASAEGKDIIYRTKFFRLKGDVLPDEININSFDPTINEGGHRADISRIGAVARRFSELRTAAKLASELNAGDVIVLDGTLQAIVAGEDSYLDELYSAALKNSVIVTALAKTTSVLTKNGNSLAALLNELGPEGKWFYFPVCSISDRLHRAELFFVKLHEKSRYVFRFEVFNKSEFDADELFGIFAAASSDPAFLGYPYGLVDADLFARVSNEERGALATQFVVRAGKSWKKISKYANALNAHDVLDSMR